MQELHTFGEALEAVKKGKKIKRLGWNGKDQFVELGINISYMTLTGLCINSKHETMGNAALVFNGTSGIQVGWLASQSDMLSEDWVIFE